MKYPKQTRLVLVPILLLFLSSVLFAKEPKKPERNAANTYNDFTVFTDDEFSRIENNLLVGVKSENPGLQTSCAYFLGEMKSDKALIPLMRLARNGNTEEVRIIAGLSLYKIESHIGLHMLKGRAQNDDSELVRKTFDRLYRIYISKKYSF